MHEDADRFAFPDLPEEAVVALDQFLEDFYHHFQNHYFAQLPPALPRNPRTAALQRSHALTIARRSAVLIALS